MEIDFPQISISTYYGCPLKSVYLHTWAPAREAKVGYCHVAPHPLGKSGKNSLYGIFFLLFLLMWDPFRHVGAFLLFFSPYVFFFSMLIFIYLVFFEGLTIPYINFCWRPCLHTIWLDWLPLCYVSVTTSYLIT